MPAKKKKLSPREQELMKVHDDLRAELGRRGWRVETARSLNGRGGNCIVQGERRVILRGALPASERVDILWEALQREPADEIETASLPESVQAWRAASVA